uniref:Uncharacterized protein n=1 Tax=viral metagenome TaxID=1070528 RepID=A0A6C0ERJ8_9ZZZZ
MDNIETENNYETDSDTDSSYTDNESVINEYDSDDEDRLNVLYDPEEISSTQFNIVLCELYNEDLHGTTNNINIQSSYFVIRRYKYLEYSILNMDSTFYNNEYINARNILIQTIRSHPIIKNYLNIISRQNYIKPEIAKCIYLNTGECICILKTFWIRLIQRAWKKMYNNRKSIIQKRCLFKSLVYRETTGKWPANCIQMPTLKGMLSYLSK